MGNYSITVNFYFVMVPFWLEGCPQEPVMDVQVTHNE
jgi:hypothetical protein